MPRTPILVVVSVAFAISSGVGRATVIHVPTDHATIQLGIDHAAGGDTLGPLATFASGKDTLSMLVGLTLQHGRAPWGGGILCQFSAPRISGSVFVDNVAHDAGGCGTSVSGEHTDERGGPVASGVYLVRGRAAGRSSYHGLVILRKP